MAEESKPEKTVTSEKIHPIGIRKATLDEEMHFITSRCIVMATTYVDGPGRVSVVGANLVLMTPEEAYRVGAALTEASRVAGRDKDPFVLDYATSSKDGSTQAVVVESEELPAREVRPAPQTPPAAEA